MPTASLVSLGDKSAAPDNRGDGLNVGGASSSLVGFYGATPVVQPAGFGAVTDASVGTASATNGILALTATYNSSIIVNSIATLAAQTNAIEAALVALGLISV